MNSLQKNSEYFNTNWHIFPYPSNVFKIDHHRDIEKVSFTIDIT